MKPNTSLEQGVCAMLMLALQEGHTPVRSDVIARVLDVSDSYMKKILRKLVVADLIESSAQRGGGYTLALPASKISLADAYRALCGPISPELSDLPYRVFPDKKHTEGVKAMLADALEDADNAYLAQLGRITLDDMLDAQAAKDGAVNWEEYEAR